MIGGKDRVEDRGKNSSHHTHTAEIHYQERTRWLEAPPNLIAETVELEYVMQRIVRKDAVIRLGGKGDRIEIIDQERRGPAGGRLPRLEGGSLDALCAQIDGRDPEAVLGEFDRQVSFAAAELEDVRTGCGRSLDEISVPFPEEDFKKLLIVPDLRILRILLNLAPMLRFLLYELTISFFVQHAYFD